MTVAGARGLNNVDHRRRGSPVAASSRAWINACRASSADSDGINVIESNWTSSLRIGTRFIRFAEIAKHYRYNMYRINGQL